MMMTINGWFVVACIAIALLLIGGLMFLGLMDARATTQAQYMIIGRGDLNFDCVDEYPYNDLHRMDWNASDGLTEVNNDYHLMYWIVEVASCNADAIYRMDDRPDLFTLRFTDIECIGNRCAAHMTRGAWWIEPR